MNTLHRSIARSCVERGIELLNRKRCCWNCTLNANTIKMGSVSHCMLAQLFKGSYAKGRKELGLTQHGAAIHGFWFHPEFREIADIKAYYDYLTELWQHAVRYGGLPAEVKEPRGA